MIAFPDLPRARGCATTLTTRAGLDLAAGGSLELDLARTLGEAPGAPLQLTLNHVQPGGRCDLFTLALTPAEVYGLLGLFDTAFARAMTDRVLLPPAAAAELHTEPPTAPPAEPPAPAEGPPPAGPFGPCG